MSNEQFIIGIDEAGRGALAGPVVVAGFGFNPTTAEKDAEWISELNDSKKLSAKKREELYNKIWYNSSSVMCIEMKGSALVDACGILNTVKECATCAAESVASQYVEHVYPNTHPEACSNVTVKNDGGLSYVKTVVNTYDKLPELLVKVDGDVPLILNKMNQECIVKGDQTVPEIMAASIIAKVYRDHEMDVLSAKLAEKFGGTDPYNLSVNKGYGTPEHIKAIELYGPSEYHRKTFKRVKEFVHES